MCDEKKIQAYIDKFQLEMFDLGDDTQYKGDDGIVCNNCGNRQPPDQFQHMQSGEIKRKCNSCRRNQSQLIKKLKDENDYPDETYACPICERDMEEISKHGQARLQNWVLDHCHATETFRGWICHHCNTGLGAFKDKLERIKRAVHYLERHQNEIDS